MVAGNLSQLLCCYGKLLILRLIGKVYGVVPITMVQCAAHQDYLTLHQNYSLLAHRHILNSEFYRIEHSAAVAIYIAAFPTFIFVQRKSCKSYWRACNNFISFDETDSNPCVGNRHQGHFSSGIVFAFNTGKKRQRINHS